MSSAPIVLFGAFDRHNLGDILLGRAAALAAAPRSCLFAGLRPADLQAAGGFRVEALATVLAGWRRRFGAVPLDLVHVGGEILDTDAWEAAVMLQAPPAVQPLLARLDADPAGRAAWAADFLGSGRPAPYAVGRAAIAGAGRVEFRAVGGVGLAGRDRVFADAVVQALGSADALTVRDHRTRSALAGLGVAAELAPDPVAGLGEWLRAQVAGPVAPAQDYLACQCAADFGDDASLDALAAGLDAIGLPVLLFRAGAAPWHDDLGVYRRLAGRLKTPARLFSGLHVNEICAAIAGARLCLASSLHALLVAGMFRLPALGLERRPGEGLKLRAYAETWGGFQVVAAQALAGCIRATGFQEKARCRSSDSMPANRPGSTGGLNR